MSSWLYSPPHRHTSAVHRVAFIPTLLFVLTFSWLSAQTPVPEYPADSNQFVNRWAPSGTAASIRPVWGVDTNEFWVGGYVHSWPKSSGLSGWQDWWKFWSDTSRFSLLETREVLWDGGTTPQSTWMQMLDSMVATMRPRTGTTWSDRLILSVNYMSTVGWARELVLFPFDTTNSALWHSGFLQFNGGEKKTNQTYGDHRGAFSSEMHYDTTNTTPGATIAQELVAGYDSLQYGSSAAQHRLHIESMNDSVGVQEYLSQFSAPTAIFGNDRQTVFALRGHLFDVGLSGGRGISTGLTDTLLFVDIYSKHLIGASYYDHTTSTASTASSVTEYLYASLPVRKSDLLPRNLAAPDWDEYREVVLRCDLHDINGAGVRGPFHPSSASQHFDLRLRWTGKEKVAVRLLAVRDSLAQLLFGKDTLGNQFKQYMLDWTQRVIVGPGYPSVASLAALGNPAPLDSALSLGLRKVIRVNTGDEGSMLGNAGFSWADSVLYTYLGNRDSIARGDTDRTHHLRTFRAQGIDAMVQTSQNEIVQEMSYIHAPLFNGDTNISRQDYFDWLATTAPTGNYQEYGVATPMIMAIREHNGGSFGIPELHLYRYDIDRATDFYQRALVGWRSTELSRWPFNGDCNRLGHAADRSRLTGRRMVVYQGVHTRQHVPWMKDTSLPSWKRVPQPTFAPFHEPSQMRMSANLALCYGARGLHFSFFGSNLGEFSDNYATQTGFDTTGGVVMRRQYLSADWGPIGPNINRQENYLDTLVLASAQPIDAYRTVIRLARDSGDSVYMGWGVRFGTVQWLTTQWLPRITPELMKLRWRDAYSVCFSDSLREIGDTNINHTNPGGVWPNTMTAGSFRLNSEPQAHYRRFDSNEIVRSVAAYDRWGGKDSIWKTYVEVGLFDSIPGPSGYDTNYLYLVNRRTFERSPEINPASARGKTMDSLAEWRRAFVQLRVHHPDTTLYDYVRVREIGADTTRAPWATAARTPLDTVVNVDSAFALWMRPGGGALLQVTYVVPSDTTYGNLAYNNAKRVFFDGTRYHVVYAFFETGKNDTTSYYDQIYYMSSYPVDSVERAVRWNWTKGCVVNFKDGMCDAQTRWQNRHPALTVRKIGDSSLVTIVWTCHPDTFGLPSATREVMTRSFMLDSGGTIVSLGNMQRVSFYRGAVPSNPTSWGEWGTPVVSTLHGAEVFAWSDSVAGIVARLHTTGTAHIPCVPVFWSNYDTVSKTVMPFTGCYTHTPGIDCPLAHWPTMPPVAHIASLDSNVGIAWQQGIRCGPPYTFGDVIYYKRLVHSGTLPTPILSSQNDYVVTPVGLYEHPSLDLWQDTWYQCFEGVAWEEKTGSGPNYGSTLWFRPIATETRLRGGWNPFWDSIGTTWGWAFYSHILHNPGSLASGMYPNLWPSAVPLNEVMVPADSLDTAHFAIAYMDSVNTMSGSMLGLWQTQVYYGMSTAIPGFPKQYSFSGFYPAMSGSGTKQKTRAVTLYESNHDANASGNSVIGPTHQFFARLARPRGYLATGREVWMLDAMQVGASVGMMDLWVSDEDSSHSLAMGDRTSTRLLTDSLDPAVGMVRSAVFTTHDSAVVGVRTRARMRGDSTYAASVGMAIHLRWELVEESSGSVVGVLDSTVVDAAHPTHDSLVERVFDLMSGSYRVRMIADTVAIAPRALSLQESRWPVVETSTWVEELATKMVRQGEAQGSRTRLDVQPNPATDHAEVLVSVPADGDALITLTSIDGRTADVLYEGVLDRGRYSMPVQLSNLRAGVYLIELVAGRQRLVRKLIVR